MSLIGMPKRKMRRLREIEWRLHHHSTFAPQGRPDKIDLYVLSDDEGTALNTVTLNVPHGRRDLAEFIYACIQAGITALGDMPDPPPGAFTVHEPPGGKQ